MKQAIARHWAVGEVESITPLGGGSINGAFRVEAEAGSFHLRVYRRPERVRVEREHGAIALALSVGIPTPGVLQTRHGSTTERIGGQWAALFQLAPGAPLSRPHLTPGTAAILGAFLAKLHRCLPQRVKFSVSQVCPSTVGQTVEKLERIKAVLMALPQPDERDDWALERTRQRLEYLRTAAPDDHVPAFQHRFLHGDYHDGNVFLAHGQPVSIIDWEQTRLAPRAWEIVRALHLSLGLRPALCTAFLAGYREVLSLDAAELDDGARFYTVLQERNVWTYESVYLENNPGPKAFIRPPPYVPFGQAWREAGLV